MLSLFIVLLDFVYSSLSYCLLFLTVAKMTVSVRVLKIGTGILT